MIIMVTAHCSSNVGIDCVGFGWCFSSNNKIPLPVFSALNFCKTIFSSFFLDFVSIKSLPTKQTAPKSKVEVNSDRKQAASHLLNTTVDEGKILDQQTSWRKITDRNITLHFKICYELTPSLLSSFLK